LLIGGIFLFKEDFMAGSIKPRGNVVFSANVESQTDANTETNSTDNAWLSLSVYNNGVNDLNLTVNNILIVISANETFDDDFEDFNSVRIEPSTAGQSIAYRLVIRG
jgi:hypothetical protein